MEIRFLSIPATSSPSERVWSIASNTITKDRARLDSHFVSDLIFLKEKGDIFKKNYSLIEGRDRILPNFYEANINNLVDAVKFMLLDEIDNEES